MQGGYFVSLAVALVLGGCSKGASDPAAPKVAEVDRHIECALGPGVGFVRDCTIERSQEGGLYKMIVRHSDGGFRRFEVGADNTIVASDGADAAQVVLKDAVAEVTVGEDRYRIPLEAQPPAGSPGGTPASADVPKP